MDVAALGADLGLVAAVGGALSLDRRAAFQTMVSQPLAAVPLLGLLLGDLETGLWLGALLQLLWMSSAMFGANVPPNETVASVVVAGGVLLSGRFGHLPDVTSCTAGILFGVPFAYLGRRLEIWLDHQNLRLAERADAAPQALSKLVGLSVLRAYVMYALVIWIGAAFVTTGVWWIAGSLEGVPRAALVAVGVYGIPSLAVAVALTGIARRRGWVLAAATFVLLIVAIGGRG